MTINDANKKQVAETIEILKALADEIRLEIAKFVAESKTAVPSCDVVSSFAKKMQLSQPAMSHHFKKLVDAEILLHEKHGTQNFYRFNQKKCQLHGINITKL